MWFCCCKSCNDVESNRTEDGEMREPYIPRDLNAENIERDTVFFINGQIRPEADRFAIDFCLNNDRKDVAFRLAGSIKDNTLARSSRIGYEWSEEETDTKVVLNLYRCLIFEFQVYFTDNYILVAFCGQHIASYRHLIPFKLIRGIKIRGDLMNVLVIRQSMTIYPAKRCTPKFGHIVEVLEVEDLVDGPEGTPAIPVLRMPYLYPFKVDKFIKYGYKLIIKGIIKPRPDYIIIALKVGEAHFPNSRRAIQMEIYFNKRRSDQSDEPVIYFDSYTGNRWRCRLSCLSPNGLRPGAFFNLIIAPGDQAFKVYINDNHIYNYPYYMELDHMDTCYVDGDINLTEIRQDDN